jgi:hypothetical protein
LLLLLLLLLPVLPLLLHPAASPDRTSTAAGSSSHVRGPGR